MTELVSMFGDGEEESSEAQRPEVDAPADLRVDLSELGIIEVERGVCEDTVENRATLRRAKLRWEIVYDGYGRPTNLIVARSRESQFERRAMVLASKRPIMADPDVKNSDYLTGYDLLAESAADLLVPPWVIGATKAWIAQKEDPSPDPKRASLVHLPHRCRYIMDTGERCMLWSSGRIKDDGLCKTHLRYQNKKQGDDVARARMKLTQAAPYAVDVLEELMFNAEESAVRLRASSEILDRAGVRGGIEIDSTVTVDVKQQAAQQVSLRLKELADNMLPAKPDPDEDDPNTEDAVIVLDGDEEDV